MTERNDELNDKLGPLYKWLFTEPNPIGVNTMLMMLGMSKPVFRLPYTPRDASKREEALEILKEIGLEHCPAGSAKGLQVLSDSEFSFKLGGD